MDSETPTLDRWYAEGAEFVESLRKLDHKPITTHCKIDGLAYTNNKLPTAAGLEVWGRLGQLVGSAVLRRVAAGDGSPDWGMALVSVCNAAVANGLTPLIIELLSETRVDQYRHMPAPESSRDKGGGLVVDEFDEHFRGEYAHLVKVCAWVVWHNLAGPTLGSRSTSGTRSRRTHKSPRTGGSTTRTSRP